MVSKAKKYYSSFWNSPTLMTWLSYSTKALSLFVVLPLILKQFAAPEISLWYLFSSIFVLLGVADMGFRQTFVRIIAYTVAGADKVGIYTASEKIENKGINWAFLERIYASMKIIYRYLTVFLLVLLIIAGSLLLYKPISLVQDKEAAWIAWGVIILANIIRFYGTIYQNYLEGFNKIALVRKIESFMSLGSILTSIAVLLFGGDILALVIAHQMWLVLNVVRNWYLSRIIEDGRLQTFENLGFDRDMFWQIWSPAWRTGVSVFMSNGLTHLSGLLYAQIGDPRIVASYLLALRIITQIKEISMAPFYSKIPYMSRLRAEGKVKELVSVSQRGMFLSHLVFVIGVSLVAVFSDYLLGLIKSNVVFVSPMFWCVLSFAFFVHRYGAMHMQLYLTTNHIIAHIADGISGLIFIVFGLTTVNWLGIYAIPMGMLAGYLGFYAWYAAYYSYKSLSIRFLDFEYKTSFIPIIIFIIAFIIIYEH